MAHIKWVGIIKTEIAEYQKGHLDSKAMKMELPATMKAMMIKALPFVIVPFVTIFLSLFIKTGSSRRIPLTYTLTSPDA